jgi:uncharacterized membrane protein YeiB
VSRIEGLDAGRSVAIMGMIVINYKFIFKSSDNGSDLLVGLMRALEGRFAAIFVILAGIGLGLMQNSYSKEKFLKVIPRRIIFFLIIGLLHRLIWWADIIHFYAFYFLLGLILVWLPSVVLLAITIGLPYLFSLVISPEYRQGFRVETDTIQGIVGGTLLRVFWNGFYPVFPWISLLIIGILLSRLDLQRTRTLVPLFIIGVTLFLLPLAFGQSVDPYPPIHWFMMSVMGSTFIVLSLILRFDTIGRLLKLDVIGRYALSIYLAHAIPAIGLAYVLRDLEIQLLAAIIMAVSFFSVCSLLSIYWDKKHDHGPAEALMRKFSN